MKQYSTDLRERMCRARDAGLARSEVVRLFGVSASSVSRWHAKAKVGESLAPKVRPGRTPKIGPEQAAELRAQVLASPDATLQAQAEQWEAAHGVRVSTATMSRRLKRLGLPLKKRR